MTTKFKNIAAFACMISLVACSEAKPVHVDGGTNKDRNAGTETGSGAEKTGLFDNLKDGLSKSKGAFIDAEFAGELKVIGIKICSLNLRVKLLPLSSLSSGKIFDLDADQFADCGLFGQVDVSKMLGGLSGGAGQGPGLGGLSAEVSNNIVYLNSMGGSTFSPGRPVFPAIGAATRSELNGMHDAREVTVQMADGKVAPGNAVLDVVRFGGAYTAEKMGYTFKDSAEMKLEHVGFEGLDAINTFLMPREMTLIMGLAPFAIAHIGLKLELRKLTDLFKNGSINNEGLLPPGIGDLLNGGGNGGLLGTIVKIAVQLIKVDITLDLLRADFPKDDLDKIDPDWDKDIKTSKKKK